MCLGSRPRVKGGKHRTAAEQAAAASASTSQAPTDELIQLRAFHAALTTPIDSADTFDLLNATGKEALARQLWLGGFAESMTAVRAANPVLVAVLTAKIANQWDARSSPHHQAAKERQVNGLLLGILRAQSKFHGPLITAGLSVMGTGQRTSKDSTESVRHFFRGALFTTNFTDGLIELARSLRPEDTVEILEGTAIVTFDNLTMQMQYGSYVREGEGGELKNMTNWFSCVPPRSLAPPGYDEEAIFMRGIFHGSNLSLSQFCRSFYLDHHEIASNRSSRWTRIMRQIQNGKHLDRPSVPPTWTPRKVYHDPVFDKLQSSYDDVRQELNIMRAALPNKKILFVAGDGLSLMRLNHLLAQEPDVYLDQTPVVVPIQGEAPHGIFHGMHAHWRLYDRFIMRCAAVLNNPQIKADPGVSDYNVHRFFLLHVVTPAAAEYIHEVCETDVFAEDWDDPVPFMAKAAANIDFDWLCHFLHDNAFWVLDFLQSVRGNDSKKLDLLWREFFSAARTGKAHKTQYVGMAIMRVFWGQAMTPELDALYHAIRTIPSGTHDGCGVGWDWAVEMLNGAIRSHVDKHVSEVQIRAFTRDWALLETVQVQLRDLIYSNRAEQHWRGRDVRADIEKLKAFFRSTIGSTWARATRANASPNVLLGETRSRPPWREMQSVMNPRGGLPPHQYIRQYVLGMTPFYNWRQ